MPLQLGTQAWKEEELAALADRIYGAAGMAHRKVISDSYRSMYSISSFTRIATLSVSAHLERN